MPRPYRFQLYSFTWLSIEPDRANTFKNFTLLACVVHGSRHYKLTPLPTNGAQKALITKLLCILAYIMYVFYTIISTGYANSKKYIFNDWEEIYCTARIKIY